MVSAEEKLPYFLAATVLLIGLIAFVLIRVLTRRVDARYDRWGIRTDEQARTKGTVGIEDPTGGDET